MSYSRWSDGVWYSFYNVMPDTSTKGEQVLSLWHVDKHRDFTYDELMNVGAGKLMSLYPNVCDDDIVKAMGIIRMFTDDVNNEFLQDDMK